MSSILCCLLLETLTFQSYWRIKMAQPFWGIDMITWPLEIDCKAFGFIYNLLPNSCNSHRYKDSNQSILIIAWHIPVIQLRMCTKCVCVGLFIEITGLRKQMNTLYSYSVVKYDIIIRFTQVGPCSTEPKWQRPCLNVKRMTIWEGINIFSWRFGKIFFQTFLLHILWKY